MPSFGLGELILIGIAIIIFVRPEDLPNFVRKIGRAYGEMRRLITKYQRYTQETLNEIAQIEPNTNEPIQKASIPENTESYECDEYRQATKDPGYKNMKLQKPSDSAGNDP